MEGWDFGWLKASGRFEEDGPPWDYRSLVAERAKDSPDLLDLGTGGGERLAAVSPRPKLTVATESYAPNVTVASHRLAPLGIQVVHTRGARDNDEQKEEDVHPALPFRDGAFHLVIDRNEAFVAREVARILVPGGVFLTEQSGASELSEISGLFDLPTPTPAGPVWDLSLARRQLRRAGLRVSRSAEATFEMRFRDIGALVGYLRMVPWAAPGFSPVRHRAQLRELHERLTDQAPLRIQRSGFWMEAVKEHPSEY